MKLNHAILHVFDFNACVNTLANEEMDLANKNTKNYVSRHAKRALENLDNRRGEFSSESRFAPVLEDYARGIGSFVELSRNIAEYIAEQLGYQEKSDSCDLLVVDFEDEVEASVGEMSEEEANDSYQGRGDRYLAILILDAKPAYAHESERDEYGCRNDVVRHRVILPGPSQKVQSYAVVDLRTLDVRFCDKKRTIAGEEMYLIPDGLLQCSSEPSVKESFSAVIETVEAVAEEYGANPAVAASRAKAYVADNAEASDDVYLEEIARDVFESDEMRDRFEQAASAREIPEHVSIDRQAAQKVAKSHKIRTDTGIEITFPAAYSRNPEYLTFTSEADGTYSISMRNIGHIENRF